MFENFTTDLDSVSIGIIDFKNDSFEIYDFTQEPNPYYDLASITKVLTLGLTYLTKKDVFSSDMKLLLNHKSGLPAWGLLSRNNWREFLLSYNIKESKTEYSDFGALRLMLELEKKIGPLYDHCKKYWDQEVVFWKDLPFPANLLPTGFRNKREILGEVHDPNAYIIGEFCSHAGVFATPEGLCRTLLKLNSDFNLLSFINKEFDIPHERYVGGWDTVEDFENTTAGKGCSEKTFGHLGFTGTSVWIDSEKKKGVIVLSNATKDYWFEKEEINRVRKEVGTLIWT